MCRDSQRLAHWNCSKSQSHLNHYSRPWKVIATLLIIEGCFYQFEDTQEETILLSHSSFGL